MKMAEDKKKTAEDVKVEKAKTRKAMTTTKKVKVIGKEQYINAETGEVEVMNVVSVEDRDFNFHKLWLGHILNSIDLIGNQKTRLAFWILDNLDSENKLIYTYEQIRKETGISSKTIADTFKALASSNFLKKKQSGVWIVNPDFIYKGYSAKVRKTMTTDMKMPQPIYQVVLDGNFEKYPGYGRLLRRKQREYENQEQSFAEMPASAGIAAR